MLQICQFFIFNAAPKAKVEYRMQADLHFPECYRAYCVCVWGGEVNKNMEFFHFLGHFFTTPLFFHTERYNLGTEEGIRKFYFDNKNWKNNEARIPVEIRVLKTSFSKGRIWTVHSLSIQLIPD